MKRFAAIISGFCLISAAYGQTAPTAPPGFVVTSFFGTPIVMPLLATYMASWQQTVQNQSILSLVNQGDNSPAALSNEAALAAAAFCSGTQNAPVPDCASVAATSAVVTPIQMAITAAANTVPAGQWAASSWSPSLCSTIVLCLAVSSVAPPPPAPAPTGPLVSTCTNQTYIQTPTVMCYAGAGVSSVTASGFSYLGTTYANGAVIEYQGVNYQAHISVGLGGPSIWFSIVVAQ